MSLESVLSQAASGLDSVTRRLSTASQNIANASQAGYTREVLPVTSVALPEGGGVRSGVAARTTVDAALQADLFAAGAQVAGGQARSAALASIDAASGAPGSGQDIAGLLGSLRDAFSTLSVDPSNQTQQRQVVSAAGALAQGVNTLGAAISGARQAAQDGLVDDVKQANEALRTVGQLSDQVIAARARGQSTADLEDKRDAAMKSVGELTGAKFLPQANGDVLAVSGGTVLPLRSDRGPLSIAAATLTPGTPAAAVPALLVNGSAAPISGGRIGAQLELRDKTLPGLQTNLDGFAQGLAAGFQGQGLTLFTDASGAIPPATNGGLAQVIQVNPAIQATPRLVRDGITPGAPGPEGPAGKSSLITAVLGTVLGSGPGTLQSQAGGLVANHAGLASNAARQLGVNEAVRTSLNTKLEAGAGVTVDSELADIVRLQNSYAANAKVVSALQTIWSQLLDSIR